VEINMKNPQVSIRFKQTGFSSLRNRLLKDSKNEAFAVLLGKREIVDDQEIITVIEAMYPNIDDYKSRSLTHLNMNKNFIYDCLRDVKDRFDVDTIIDVHTHPFSSKGVSFSGTDDHDEKTFSSWKENLFDDIYYGSIVLSQSDYSARMWSSIDGKPIPKTALIKTPTQIEFWPSADKDSIDDAEILKDTDVKNGFLARSALALGLDTMRAITSDQKIAVIGVGGLGSNIAENLIHMGFNNLLLIDHDVVEFTNLNRIVGAYFEDAEEGRFKVDVVKNHLLRINPKATISACNKGIEEKDILSNLIDVDWLIVATDNHLSRFKAQEISSRYFIPLISSGVGIDVIDGEIKDMSGEVIIVRPGDRVCLNCLGRINPTKVAAEEHQDMMIGEELVKRGYVRGQDIKEPAVKTLNAMLAAMTVDALVNQYTERQEHTPILVFENNNIPVIYEDKESVERRNKQCFTCAA